MLDALRSLLAETNLRVRRRVGRLVRRTLGRVGYVPVRVVKSGVIEKFGPDRVFGFVTVPEGSPRVRVQIQLNGRDVASTWATESTVRSRHGEIRRFRFWVNDLWKYVRTEDALTVRAGGVLLPINRVGMSFSPEHSGRSTPRALQALLAEGHVFGQKGRLQLSKTLDTEWQQQVLGLFKRVSADIARVHDVELFFIYGTLLGAVRERGFIGHDVDFDAAYISRATSGPDAAVELRDLAFSLIDQGYVVEGFPQHLHVVDENGTIVDLFHLYFDGPGDDARLSFPFGIAGTTTVTRADWRGTEEIDFLGGRAVVPANAEQLVEHMYGDDWRDPKPGFTWYLDRTDRATAGVLPPEMVEEIYWANFYAHTEYENGSSFCELLLTRDDLPPVVVDIGCGDGRDSFAFGRSGRRVLGLDRSHVGVRHAMKKAADLGFAQAVDFLACDVGHAQELTDALRPTLQPVGDQPVLLYLRFFLHSIPAEVQETLLGVLGSCVRSGDMLAAEFRTTADEKNSKVHKRHYRRFQDGPAFGARLRDEFGYDLLAEAAGTGLSVYRDEDPELYRVIARRT